MMRARPPTARIPLADARALEGKLHRTRAVRLGLAAALAVCAALMVPLARALDERESAFVPQGRTGIIVLDVSASMGTVEHRKIARVLEDAAASGGRYGLILFSDSAYEALPTGTPGAALREYARFFLPRRRGESREVLPVLSGDTRAPAAPWAESFTGGTRISTGLTLARDVLTRERVPRPAVVLVSDLATAQSDLANLNTVLLDYGRKRISLRAVALGATRENKAFFRELLETAEIQEAPPPRPRSSYTQRWTAPDRPFPRVLAAAAIALFALLALNELWCVRLSWGRVRPAIEASP